MSLELTPITIREANEYVVKHHRHNGKLPCHKFSIGVKDGEKLVGVCICGRPIARLLDNGKTLEINRVCTDGTRNACSILYGAACRAAKAMGYKRIITYTLESEPGTSLKAAGFINEGLAGGSTWNRRGRPRDDMKYPQEKKIRWGKQL